jgi:hypothetical protein
MSTTKKFYRYLLLLQQFIGVIRLALWLVIQIKLSD